MEQQGGMTLHLPPDHLRQTWWVERLRVLSLRVIGLWVHQHDDEPGEDNPDNALAQVDVQDVDTLIEELAANMNDQVSRRHNQQRPPGPGHARVNDQTWQKLANNDRVSWDLLSDSGKLGILNCSENQSQQCSQQRQCPSAGN